MSTAKIARGHGIHRPHVDRHTMDMSLIDVTALHGRVVLDEEVLIIGYQGCEESRADELAARPGTINYEIVNTISRRVPGIAVVGTL